MTNNLGALEIKLFRFNHSVDYLPYYRTYNIEYHTEECIYDILNKINKIEKFSYDEKENCDININSYFMPATILVVDVVKSLGDELTINPISLYRATNDLIINTKDYEEKLALFDAYLSAEQKESFQNKYKLEYYASHTMIINKDYIGDHSLLIADEIISNNPELKKEVLKIITDEETGILYHTSLVNRMFETRIDVEIVYENLLKKIDKYKNIKSPKREKTLFPEKLEIIQYFKGFNISLYDESSCEFEKIVKQSRASYIEIESKKADLAFNSQFINKEFSLKIAGEILLEAKDKNADFIIVKDNEDLKVFDAMQTKIQSVVNREINLPVITQAQFIMLLKGEKDSVKLGCNIHKIKVSFLE